jgi:hypothetical protein
MQEHASSQPPSRDEAVPPYAIPAIGEEIRVYDGTSWQSLVPAVYLGYEHVSDDFFMHRVRSESGAENSLASHAVFRRHRRTDSPADLWEPLTVRPRPR